MTAFRYEAVDAAGRKRRGTVEAETARRARREVTGTGLTLLTLSEARTSTASLPFIGGEKTPKPKAVIAATRQLATLVGASMPVEESLAAVAAQDEGTPMARVLTQVRTRVVEGWRLSDALSEHPKAFSSLYTGVVAAGESSGTLGPVLERLAEMLERNRALLSKAIGSLIYPAVISVVAITVVWALMTFVVPQMVAQFGQMGAELPLVTRAVIAVSDFVRDWGLVLFGVVVAAIVGVVVARRREGPRRAMDHALLSAPLLGPLARDLDAARFSRTLATLFAAGTPLLEAISGARRTITNAHIRQRLETTQTAVREGASLAGALRRADVFPPLLASMVSAGERSGQLPLMLEKTAEQMERGFEATTNLALRLLEPTIIVTLGGVVLVIVLAIMMPILQINNAVLG